MYRKAMPEYKSVHVRACARASMWIDRLDGIINHSFICLLSAKMVTSNRVFGRSKQRKHHNLVVWLLITQ